MKIVYEQKLKDSGVNASLEFRFFFIFSVKQRVQTMVPQCHGVR